MNKIKILTEEDFKNIKDAKNIASKANKALENLKKDIAYLNNAKNPVCWKNNSINTYIILIKDLWELKDGASKYLTGTENKKYKKDDNLSNIANNIISVWNNAYLEMQNLNKAILNYNKKFPKKQLKTLEELTGLKIKPTVKTKYFNY